MPTPPETVPLERLQGFIARAFEAVGMASADALAAAELMARADLTGQEIADLLGISRPTVVRELTMARAWLRRGLGSG